MAFRAALIKGKTADCHILLKMIMAIKVPRDRFKCVFVEFLSRRCFRNRSSSRLPVSPMYKFLQRVQVTQKMTLAEVQVK